MLAAQVEQKNGMTKDDRGVMPWALYFTNTVRGWPAAWPLRFW